MKHLAKVNVPLYLREKRANKADRRDRRQWRRLKKNQISKEALNSHFGKVSKIVQMVAQFSPNSSKVKKGRIKFHAPKEFSIIDAPETTLEALTELASQLLVRRVRSVFIDLGKTTQYDLGANGILDVLVEELTIQARQTRRRIRWHGSYPIDSGLRRFVKAMGVIKRLEVTHEYPGPEEVARLEVFDERCKHYVRAVRPNEADRKSMVTQRFADHINHCLRRVGRVLDPGDRHRLCQYVGEVIDNAEEHADMLDWSIQGYLDTHLETLVCEITIFSFGKTIAETFEALPHDHYTKIQIQRYIDTHQKGGFFQPGWRPQDLFTLIALQGHVSSKNESVRDTRGNGTVDLIEFFQTVHQDCAPERSTEARMILVSGSTYILFDGKYKMKPDSNGIRIIAFNNDNDLEQRPDAKYVRQLDHVSFPGTLLSIKFPLSTVEITPTAVVEVNAND